MLRVAWFALAVSVISAQDLMRLPAGVTRAGEPIPSLVTPDDFDYDTKKLRILLAGGGANAIAAIEDYYSNGGTEQLRARIERPRGQVRDHRA